MHSVTDVLPLNRPSLYYILDVHFCETVSTGVFLRAKRLLLFCHKRNKKPFGQCSMEMAWKYFSDEMIGRLAQGSCLSSLIRPTDKRGTAQNISAQLSSLPFSIDWGLLGLFCVENPISTFHICAPRGWMGLPSQAGHLWEGLLCGRGRLSKPFPCLDASCNGYFFKHGQIKLFEFLFHSSSSSAPSASNNKWARQDARLIMTFREPFCF